MLNKGKVILAAIIISVVVFAAGRMAYLENRLRHQEVALLNMMAQVDTTRQIDREIYARMAGVAIDLAVRNIDMDRAIDRLHGQLVFIAESIKVRYDTIRLPPIPSVGHDGLFQWGPADLRLGTLRGTIDTRDSTPTFAPMFSPYPLSIDFAVVRHDDKPWEAVIRVQPYGAVETRFIDIPQVASTLVTAPAPVCRRWLAIVCDAHASLGAGAADYRNRLAVVGAGVLDLGLVGGRLRAIGEITTEPRGSLILAWRLF